MNGDGIKIVELKGLTISMLEQVGALYEANGWGDAYDYPADKIGDAFQHGIGFCAVDGGQVLGFIRGFSDFMSMAWIGEVLVRPDRHKAHVGSMLMKAFVEASAVPHVYCEALDGNDGFFKKCGFKVRPKLTAMSVIVESRRTQAARTEEKTEEARE